MRLSEIITEVKVPFTRSKGQLPKSAGEQEPLKDSDTIRVYHGVNSSEDIAKIMTVGLSGKERANRRYSYEGNNNPRGLFVTIDLAVAKEFGPFIIEFHAKVSDLEAPVWPGGAYTVQGGYASYFDSDDDRNKATQAARERAKKDKDLSISQSDKPELANTLFAFGESQALFTGELNPKSIRAVWVQDNPDRVTSSYTRLTRLEFVKLLSAGKLKGRYDTKVEPYNHNKSDKMFAPRDQVTLDAYLDKLEQEYKHLNRDELLDIIKDDNDHINRHLWPAQAISVKKELK